MTPAERSALVRSARAREMGGMALFTCPRFPGGLRIRPQACGQSYARRRAAARLSDDWIRLEPCRGCPVGASNVDRKVRVVAKDRVGSFAQVRRVRDKELYDIAHRVLVATPGIDAGQGGEAMSVSRATARARFLQLEAEGRARRVDAPGRPATWWPVDNPIFGA